MALKIAESDWQKLRHHGEETYPHECCGVLLGEIGEDDTRFVHATIPCCNTRSDSPQNRYHIDPGELVRIQREARGRGLDIVGFYHSHPDCAARWSQTDLADAHWTGCSYVITSVEKGRAAQTSSFALIGEEASKRFEDEPITLENSLSQEISV